MAITNLIEKIAVARIADCEIKVYVAGTATTLVDIAEVSDVKASVSWNSAEAKGDGSTFAVSSKLDKADITFGSMCLSAALLSALTGDTVSTPDATTETSNFNVASVPPYFSFEIQSTDITGLDVVDATNGLPADIHVNFGKCKITKIDNILPTTDGFATISVTAVAIPDSTGLLFKLVKNATATAIA
jgi:hypothetical protein